VNPGLPLQENHVAAVPVCGPSRSSLLLSKFPHNNGYKMNGDIPSVASFCGPGGHMNDTVGNWLARAGFYTAFLGKHINNCEWATEQGWSHWGGLINTVRAPLRPLPAFPSCLHPTSLPATFLAASSIRLRCPPPSAALASPRSIAHTDGFSTTFTTRRFTTWTSRRTARLPPTTGRRP